MCGIAGAIQPGLQESEWRSKLQGLADALAHRGAEKTEEWLVPDPGVGLIQRRLLHLETDSLPLRPFHDRFVLVLDGRIYNYRELRHELARQGYELQTRSDEELLLALVESWGIERTLSRITGMFAIAIWDHKERILTLARDRIGEKPLYYAWTGQGFVFGSELRAYRSWAQEAKQTPKIRLESAALYARYHYVPGPYTVFENAFKLLPGTYLRLTLEDLLAPRDFSPECSPTSYWSATQDLLPRLETFAGSDEQAQSELRSLLRSAVRSQLVTDVPCGAFLSGGVDSSLIAATLQELSLRPIPTFSIRYSEKSTEESTLPQRVAARLGTEHHEFRLGPSEALDAIPKLPLVFDEPFSDWSQVGAYFISKFARTNVRVLLSGEGGDEAFGGYNRYKWGPTLWAAHSIVPRLLRRSVAGALCWPIVSLAGRWGEQAGTLRYAAHRIEKFGHLLRLEEEDDIYGMLMSCWQTPVIQGIREPARIEAGSRMGPLGLPQRWMLLDLLYYLPDDVLVKIDRSFMHWGLEARNPFLDYRLVEFATTLPLRMKIRRKTGKWILKELLSTYLPTEWIQRPRRAFRVPIGQWLKGPLRDWGETVLDRKRIESLGVYNADQVRTKWDEHLKGRCNWDHHLWNAIVFHAWAQKT